MELLSSQCQAFFKDHGVVHQWSLSYIPQQNGRIECKHRHLLDITTALHLHTSIPKEFQEGYVSALIHLVNRVPTA